jgi:hypothetical protein
MSVLSSNFGSCFHGHFFLWFTRFYSPFVIVLLPWLPSRRCGTRHNGIRYNDTRHNGFNYCETLHIVTTSVSFFIGHYAECHHTECRGAPVIRHNDIQNNCLIVKLGVMLFRVSHFLACWVSLCLGPLCWVPLCFVSWCRVSRRPRPCRLSSFQS